MFEALLVTTSSDGLQPLGSAAQRSWELVTSTLRTRLGPEHADLFAEPVASEHGDRIDWHAAMPGKAAPLADLPAAEQQDLRARLGVLVADIRTVAQRLADDGGAENLRLSEALTNALEIPGEAMIWAVHGDDGTWRPVLVHWAWVRNEQTAVRGILTGLVPRPVSAAGLAAQPGRRLPPWLIWLGWVLLALLLGAILWLLVAPCGLRPAGPDLCPGDDPAVAAAFAEQAVIADEIAALERGLALAGRDCQPTVPVVPAPDRRGADAPDIETRLAGRGANLGELNFALAWQGGADLDLSVTCPGGETVSSATPAACDGALDLTANDDPGNARDDPLENIVFREAKPGIYKVRVHLRRAPEAGGIPLTLYVLRSGSAAQSHPGSIVQGDADWTVNMSISR